MNLLILSCGTRNKLVRFFKEKESGFDRVIATDVSPYAPALYEADRYYLVPPMTDPAYVDRILELCREEKCGGILPLFEDELTIMARCRERFEREGIQVIVSALETVELCRDKYRFYVRMKEAGLPVLPTCLGLSEFRAAYEKGQMDFPVFIKPVRGCGSLGISRVDHMEELEILCRYTKDNADGDEMLIQPLCTGEEYGCDLYVDRISHRLTSVFVKKKLRMRAGETEKSISVRDPELFRLLEQMVSVLKLQGPLDVDVFKMDGQYYLSEINPRFGGGYPHAFHCGVNFPRMLSENLAGRSNEPGIGNYREGISMLKYTDEMVLEIPE